MRAGSAVFRADGGPKIGAGHLVRSAALLMALKATGWQCRFAVRHETKRYLAALGLAGLDQISLDVTPPHEPEHLCASLPDGCDWLIVDHYGLDAAFEDRCRGWAKRILVLDDAPLRHHSADVLVDAVPLSPNVGPGAAGANCVFLTGPEYALLRSEFRLARDRLLRAGERPRHETARILVAFGGGDSTRATLLTLQALARLPGPIDIDIVLGVDGDLGRAPTMPVQTKVTFHRNVAAIAPLMQSADLCIGAAGVTSWERCCIGLPAAIVLTAENQMATAECLRAAGAARVLGRVDEVTPQALSAAVAELVGTERLLHDMSAAAFRLCDGRGALRVASYMDSPLSKLGAVSLRPAKMVDADMMLAWQSAPVARRYFRHPNVPSPNDHRKWMTERLQDTSCLLNMILVAGKPCGVLRLDRVSPGSEAFEVSILIEQGCQNAGVGRAALSLVRALMPDTELRAEVDPENAASQALFRAAGYSSDDGRNFSAKMAS